MSLETTLRSAIVDFSEKFLKEHTEAMRTEFAELGHGLVERVTMMRDAHRSINEAETLMGLELSPVPALVSALEGVVFGETVAPEVKSEAVAVVAAPEVKAIGSNTKTLSIGRFKKALKSYENGMATGKGSPIMRRKALAESMTELHAHGVSWGEMNRIAKRSQSWSYAFIRNAREAGLV